MESASPIIDPLLIDFTRVGVEVLSLIENAETIGRIEFVDKAVKLLPLLYVKAQLLPAYEYDETTDYAPEYITEYAYEAIRGSVARTMGAYDSFLTTHHPDMRYSEVPIGASLSEYLADVYQQTINLLGLVREQNITAISVGIGRCRYYFADYWGRHLLSALTVLHQLQFCNMDDENEEPAWQSESER